MRVALSYTLEEVHPEASGRRPGASGLRLKASGRRHEAVAFNELPDHPRSCRKGAGYCNMCHRLLEKSDIPGHVKSCPAVPSAKRKHEAASGNDHSRKAARVASQQEGGAQRPHRRPSTSALSGTSSSSSSGPAADAANAQPRPHQPAAAAAPGAPQARAAVRAGAAAIAALIEAAAPAASETLQPTAPDPGRSAPEASSAPPRPRQPRPTATKGAQPPARPPEQPTRVGARASSAGPAAGGPAPSGRWLLQARRPWAPALQLLEHTVRKLRPAPPAL